MDDEHLYFAVPKKRPLDLIKEEFDTLLRKELEGRSKRRTLVKYQYSPTEYQGNKYKTLQLKLDLQKNVFLDPSLRGKKLLMRIQDYLSNERFKKKVNEIPPEFVVDTFTGNEDSVLRNCTRYRKDCNSLIKNVANGIFPGKY
jgi:hypothetical protein